MTLTTTPPTAGIQDAARHLAEARADDAVDVLERLVATYPAYVTAHVLLGKAYEASGRRAEALEAWHRAYFLMPSSPLIIRERTRLLRTVPFAAEPAEILDVPRGPAPPEPEASSAAASVATTEAEPVPEDAWRDEPFESAESDGADLLGNDSDALLGDVPDDLDTLIQQLENAPRIRPDASFKDEAADDEEEDDEEVVSETLARIYEAQKQYGAAARAYEQLADQRPDRATELLSKAVELRRLAGESDS